MGMAAAEAKWTVEMLDALPDDGQRYEIIDGVLQVTPAPVDVHQIVGGALYAQLREYLLGSGVAYAMMSPSDVRKPDPSKNRVQPDVFAVRLRDGKRPPYPYRLTDILLAIEVESPSNPLYDYHTKRELYLGNGVPEYWIVNTDARIVSRFRTVDEPGDVLSRTIEWHPAGMPTPLVVDLAALFDEVPPAPAG
jgi:Uma2 family endonuclease